MPKSVGASLHLWLTPLLYSRDWVSSPSTISLPCTSVYSFLMILINSGGQPSLRRMMKRSSRLTVSNALTKSMKATIVVATWSSWCQCFERRCCHVFFKLSFSWNIVLMILSWNLYVQSVCTSIYVALLFFPSAGEAWKFRLWYFFRYGTLTATGDTWIPLTGVASAKWCPPIHFQQH